MNDFNIAAMLLKEYDHDKWDNLPAPIRTEIINDFLEFRNRIIIAANMGCAAKTLKAEAEKGENKYINHQTNKAKAKSNHGLRLKFVDIKTEQELIKEN